MGQTFHRYICDLCGRNISSAGMGKASHMRMHVRRNEAAEKTKPGKGVRGYSWYPTKQYNKTIDLIKERYQLDSIHWAESDQLSKCEIYFLSALIGVKGRDQSKILIYGDALWENIFKEASHILNETK